jgi:hypothetical protein
VRFEIGVAARQQEASLPALGILDRLVNSRGDAQSLKARNGFRPRASCLRGGVDKAVKGHSDEKGERYGREQQCRQELRSYPPQCFHLAPPGPHHGHVSREIELWHRA